MENMPRVAEEGVCFIIIRCAYHSDHIMSENRTLEGNRIQQNRFQRHERNCPIESGHQSLALAKRYNFVAGSR